MGRRVLPLLAGEAQRAALSLPAGSQVRFRDLRRAVLDRTGCSSEDHRRRFRSLRLGPEDRPLVLGQQLRDAATRWLKLEGPDSRVVEMIVLEQFLEAILVRTSSWIRYHRPKDLAAAVVLAEDHLAVHREARRGQRSSETAERPVPAPRRLRGPQAEAGPPGPRHRTNFPFSFSSASQVPTAADTVPPPQTVPQTPGQACWRCGQPGHVRRDCPLMEVGQVIRVVGPPAPSPGPGETYRVPVRIQGGAHLAMVDSGC